MKSCKDNTHPGMRECGLLRRRHCAAGNKKKISAVLMASCVMVMLAVGMIGNIENQIVVTATAQAHSYQNMEGSQKEIMTVAYTNTVYNAKDYNTLCRIVEAEASGEDMIGKIMVANVILNRVVHEKFPDTVYGVVYARGQFSPVSSGKINRVKVSDQTKEAVERALSGEDYSNGALYFAARSHASVGNMRWFDRSLKKVANHGGHEFYTI